MTTILIIEDEPELVKVLRSYLENAGFDVLTAYRGDTGLIEWQNRQPDLVILDLNLPGMDGLDVAREIRRSSSTPIIMLTARVEEADQLIGLEIGADDYIAKPFSPRVVVARVRALLRRLDSQSDHDAVLHIAGIEIDRQAHTVTLDGLPVDLTPTEFNLLVVLASYPGRAFTRLQLLEATQGTAYDGYERTIDTHIKNLRAKLATDPGKRSYIETVFGVGYRFMKGSQQ
jgi:two-component system alkaline phosphatase synthesis response regulator PhoP